jgi:hypothetical protein
MPRVFAWAACGLAFLLTQAASAQNYNRPANGAYSGYNPYSRPTLSPYLNLLRGGLPAANYYMGVIPEIDRRYQQNRVNQEISDLERRRVAGPEVEELLPTLPETGHATGFMTLAPYFGGTNQFGTLSTGTAASTGAAPARPGPRGR